MVKEEETEKEILQMLFHTPDSHNALVWSRPKAKRTPSVFCIWVVGALYPLAICCLFSTTLTGSWFKR